MKEELILLKNSREKLEAQKEAYKEKQYIFEVENQDLINSVEKSKDMIQKLEQGIKESTVNAYDGVNKKFDFGVGIRINKKLVYESSMAFAWAVKHQLCLSLDKKTFENLAKTQNLDFVKTEEVITATIPTKLVVE